MEYICQDHARPFGLSEPVESETRLYFKSRIWRFAPEIEGAIFPFSEVLEVDKTNYS